MLIVKKAQNVSHTDDRNKPLTSWLYTFIIQKEISLHLLNRKLEILYSAFILNKTCHLFLLPLNKILPNQNTEQSKNKNIQIHQLLSYFFFILCYNRCQIFYHYLKIIIHTIHLYSL